MSSLSAKPGYNEALAEKDALKAQLDALLDQRDAAAREFGIESQQAQQYQQQASALTPQYLDASNRLREIIASPSPDLASPTVTTGQSQSTPAPNARDDGPTQAPTSGGVGAGTSPNAFDSRGPDNTPPASRSSNQQAINTAFANQTITPRPNVLDQYASYTYAISWWLLTPEQYNNLGAAGRRAPAPGTGSWTLLIQSGGAPIAGRSQFFPDDFYFDDLEIESFLMGRGTNMSNNAMEIRFKVVEPNGITLLQRLFDAVSFAYKNPSPPASRVTDANVGFGPTVSANQTATGVPNYAAAQYCLTIEFYGYDSQGNLVAPATGSSGTGPQAVIKKYYPFLLRNITFRTQANQVEYNVVASPVPYDTGTAQARGTIPFQFALAGTTVSQLLQGGPLPAATNTRSEGRTSGPRPNPTLDTFLQQSAEIDRANAGVDALGNFTGDTTSPFNVVAP
jgi:hypothetical protein